MVEGNDKGVIELRPTPYNVILEDDSYKGEIKLGLKFIANVSLLNFLIILSFFFQPACDFCTTNYKTTNSDFTNSQGDSETKRREYVAEGENSGSICNSIMKLWNMTWDSILSFCRKTNYGYKEKGNQEEHELIDGQMREE